MNKELKNENDDVENSEDIKEEVNSDIDISELNVLDEELLNSSLEGISHKKSLELWDLDLDVLLNTTNNLKIICGNNKKPKMDLCSIINAKSGKCTQNCSFCAQSIHNTCEIDEYGLKTPQEILKNAKGMKQYCNRYSIVTSGKKVSDEEFETILETLVGIQKETGLKTCASLGILSKDQIKAFSENKIRLHNNLETSKEYFDKICTTHSYKDKYDVTKKAKKYGVSVCSGGIFGLGETKKDRHSMIYDLKELGVDSIALNLLNPIKGTKNYELIDNKVYTPIGVIEALKSIAIAKIIYPQSSVRLCGGREHVLKDLQNLAFYSLDGLMVGNYLTTDGQSPDKDLKMLKEMGFEI
ncbi:biotin synthase BioB [Methanococcus voltae]|uniref:Biotin synthase n=2 Tax=Methanococcus voltae TaxID=2188 RepID=A0A8J7US56_METVO|nr:biotin synthase BioB [Methanococcus voltae]MBP2171780.1 biotin synthase [Methanococcus voltae]MBP2201282.1 biotin synthase [Methanococcus voltae]MCS3922776.1 biotin synthase [Methanococcus voltae PS]